MMKCALILCMPKRIAKIAMKVYEFTETVGAWLLLQLLPQKLLWWQACVVSIVSWLVGCANLTQTMCAK